MIKNESHWGTYVYEMKKKTLSPENCFLCECNSKIVKWLIFN